VVLDTSGSMNHELLGKALGAIAAYLVPEPARLPFTPKGPGLSPELTTTLLRMTVAQLGCGSLTRHCLDDRRALDRRGLAASF
jgi:hypothetical protein